MSAADRVRIYYRRLPDHEEIFDQRIVLERDDVIVSVTDPLTLPEPLRADHGTILENGARAVWFTFPGAWHDIGRFHRADGTFTGYYANMLTPVEIDGRTWRTTDLFLDVWLPADGDVRILDEDELDEALRAGHIDARTAARARQEAAHLVSLTEAGSWPPEVVREWTLSRIVRAEDAPGG